MEGGGRDHVVILSLDDLSNAVSEAVANNLEDRPRPKKRMVSF